MKLFYDLRTDQLVASPGSQTPVSGLMGKAGDGQTVVIQFGRSSDPIETGTIVQAGTWTAENLPGGTVIQIAIKEDGEYSDGSLLASNSTWTNDAGAKTYTGTLNLNTTAINNLLERDDADAANDVASAECGFELTFQSGGSGAWRSSISPVDYTLYHDIIEGGEGSPANADDPTEYLLKTGGIEWLPTVSSKTGGTSADLDAVATTTRTIDTLVAFLDEDPDPDEIRVYRLEAGTDAEDSPNVIRPDDYAASTNERVWKLYKFSVADGMVNPMTTAGDIVKGGTSGAPERLAIGSTGQVLTVTAGAPAWETPFENPMTTAGDLIKGGTSGAAERLAIGTTGQVLTVTAGAPAWATIAAGAPYPSATATYSADFTLSNSDSGKLLRLDTSSNTVELTIDTQAGTAYNADVHFWVVAESTSFSGSIAFSSPSVTVIGQNTPMTLTTGETLHFWRISSDLWVLL